MTSRYDGYVLDIPLSDGIEEFVSGIKRAASRRGEDLMLIQVLQLAVTAPKRLPTSGRSETWVARNRSKIHSCTTMPWMVNAVSQHAPERWSAGTCMYDKRS